MKEKPRGEVGKLAVRGPTGCRYLADKRQSAYVRDGWNLTGDAFTQDANGYFHFAARNDDMIISAGYNIAGPEVEAALLSHPDVKECAVIGAPDEGRGQIVEAHVVLERRRHRRRRHGQAPAGSRQGDDRAVQISALGEIHRRAAEDADRKNPALPPAAGRVMSEAGAMTEPHEFLHPQNWKKPKGFANGIVAEGRMVFLAGQIGWNAEQQFDSDGFCRASAPGAGEHRRARRRSRRQAGAHHPPDLVRHRQEGISVAACASSAKPTAA